MAKPKNITEKDIEAALRKTAGIMSAAAQQLGVSRQNVCFRVNNSEKLQATLADVREKTLDIAESQLIKAINNGDSGSVRFYLKTQGKHRGYVERQETTGREGGPVLYQVKADTPPAANSIEEWIEVRKRVQAARAQVVEAAE